MTQFASGVMALQVDCSVMYYFFFLCILLEFVYFQEHLILLIVIQVQSEFQKAYEQGDISKSK